MADLHAEIEALTSAAGQLAGIGDTMTSGMSAAAGPTTGVVPPAADPVSAMTAMQFVTHAQMFQAVSAQASAIHQQIVATLNSNAAEYAAAEAANQAAAGLGG